MMKITVLVFLISCAVCGAQDTPNLMDTVAQLEKELTELKSLTQVVSLMKNNERVASLWDTSTTDHHDTASNAAALPLEVGDSVYVKLYANRLVYDNDMNYHTFTGFLLFTN